MDVYQPVGIGSEFLGYRIEELIGRGGMGVVYRAYDLRLKRPVALKLVAPSLARDERFRERFARESELVMSLEHPNVVPIYDAGDVGGRVYLAMRLVDGTDLGSLLRAEGALEPARAIAICTQIAAALDAAHASGLVHRDVKPSNVLLDGTGHVYLADFGLTRRLDDAPSELGEDGAVGTPAYLAPEQLESRAVDGRVDVYALGCVLYECLTGERVFPRDTRLAEAWAHLEEEPTPASLQRPGLPEAVDSVVARALAKEPEQRFATCGALVSAAEDALGLGKSGPSRLRRSLLLGGVVVLAIAVGVAVAEAAFGHGTRHRTAAQLFAPPNTLARIDPATNKVIAVFHVGADPVVAAAHDPTIWVYSRGGRSITQIDGVQNSRVETTSVPRAPALCCGLFSGPVLAADSSGAWFVGGGISYSRASLVHVLVGRFGKRAYPLDIAPTGVAVGRGLVWIVGHDSHHYEVLRFDPDTSQVTARTLFSPSAAIDSIAFGYGSVWVLSSNKAMLYKIDPRSARVTDRLSVAPPRATRPEIMPLTGDIWIRVTGGGGRGYSVLPYSPLSIGGMGIYGSPYSSENVGQFGALWWYDMPTGTVNRQESVDGPSRTIRVTRSFPRAGGACLSSIVGGAGSIWVTVAPPPPFHR